MGTMISPPPRDDGELPSEEAPERVRALDRGLWLAALIVLGWLLAGCTAPTPAEVDAQRARCVLHDTTPLVVSVAFEGPVVFCTRADDYGRLIRWRADELPDPIGARLPGEDLYDEVRRSYGLER